MRNVQKMKFYISTDKVCYWYSTDKTLFVATADGVLHKFNFEDQKTATDAEMDIMFCKKMNKEVITIGGINGVIDGEGDGEVTYGGN